MTARPKSLLLAMAAVRAGLMDPPTQYPAQRKERIQTCNMAPEEIAERDRPRSRQERRQAERLAAKGRTP